jgi:hypothetical protein
VQNSKDPVEIKIPATASQLAGINRAQKAALRGVGNMSFGEPTKAREELCKALVRVLKTGTAAKKMATCQLLQHVLAAPQARALLYHQQVILPLVSVCVSGALLHFKQHHASRGDGTSF